MTRYEFFCHMFQNNGLVNQNDVMKLNWLFKAKEDIPFSIYKIQK